MKNKNTLKDKTLRDLCSWLVEDLNEAVSRFGYADVSMEVLSYAPDSVMLSLRCLAEPRRNMILAHLNTLGDIERKFADEFTAAMFDEDLFPKDSQITPEERQRRRLVRKTVTKIINNGDIL